MIVHFLPIFHQKLCSRWPPNANEIDTNNMNIHMANANLTRKCQMGMFYSFLPKEGNRNDPGNWRPISQTNVYSKILERFVHTRMLRHLLVNDIITKYQFGFLPGRSTHQAIFQCYVCSLSPVRRPCQAIFQFIKHLYGSMNNNKLIGTVFLDIAKAFKCISHTTLYKKMKLHVFF